jgi:hypothetical protein
MLIDDYSYEISDNVESRRLVEKANGRRIMFRKIFCAGSEYRDVIFIELTFNDVSLFINFARMSVRGVV